MSAVKRFLALLLVFALFFFMALGVRTWSSDGGFRSLIPDILKTAKRGKLGSKDFTPADQSALDLGDVEILSRINQEYARLTKAVTPSVVSISTRGVRTEQLLDLWGQLRTRQSSTTGLGSGVIVSKEGHIITNHHVISGQNEIQVTLHDGKKYDAKLVGEDTLLDIAVIKINSEQTFSPLMLGDSSEVEVGQIVFAVGNPFGLGETVTQGIISAKERSLSDSQRDLFQTDAAINPGNSGGPLVNLTGEIIGINVSIISSDKQKPGFQGVGFSIPSNEVREALDQIIEVGRPIRGYLGVNMGDIIPSMRNELSYDLPDGSLVQNVTPGSPAEKAKLKPGDVIRSFDGVPVTNTKKLLDLVISSKIGKRVSMDVWRNGKILKLETVIAETTAPPSIASILQEKPKFDGLEVLREVGLEVRDLSTSEKMRGYRGVVVTKLLSDGKARGLIEIGDLIVAVNKVDIHHSPQFYLELATSAAIQPTTVFLMRAGKTLRVTLPQIDSKKLLEEE